jgi:hypothetical protein
MSGEIQFSYLTGKQTYAVIRNKAGQVYNTGTTSFEAYSAGNWTSYAVACTEQGSTGYYVGNFPSGITAGVYYLVAKIQPNASPQVNDQTAATGDFQWNGSAPFQLSDVATSGQLSLVAPQKVYRGQMLLNFPFKLVSSTDHATAFVSGVVSGQISRDGGTFGPLQSGGITEIGKGWYNLGTLTSGDLLANSVALIFNANGISGGTSDQRDFSFLLNRTSGQL